MPESKYSPQKKHLETKKQLRVWVDPEKYTALKAKANKNCISIYALVNDWIDQYLKDTPEE